MSKNDELVKSFLHRPMFLPEGSPAVGVSFFAPDRFRDSSNAFAKISKTRPIVTTGDVLNLLTISAKDHVAMVGNFAPMIGPVKSTGALLTIFEQIDSPEGELRPASEIPELLPKSTVCLLTATSVINHTFDKIIDAASKCRSVVLLGASTPLITEIFAHTPVSLLSGVIVTKPKEILHIVSCGGGMQKFKNVIKKINLPV